MWKRALKLLKEKKVISWIPNLKKVELEITTDCNLRCLNCDRSCRQAPSKENMSLEQIRKFVDESMQLNWRWENIALLGGEPTVHPQIFKILDILKRYKDFNQSCRIEIGTNGFGERVKARLSKMPSWVIISNSHKESAIQKFSSYNLAPMDFGKYKNAKFERGCEITEYCGLGLTRYGYYSCGSGAAVDRVFGFDMGIKKLSDVSKSRLEGQMKILCRHCGHYKDINISATDKVTEEKMSKTWQNAYEEYKNHRPSLSLY
jgi:hypothetical protein